jgi:hypothetical protein
LSATLNNNLLTTVGDTAAFELDSNAGSTSAVLSFAGNTFVNQDGYGAYFNQTAGAVTASFQNNTITGYYDGYGIYVAMATNASSHALTFNNGTIAAGYYPIYVTQSVGNFTGTCNNSTIDSINDGYAFYSGVSGSSTHTFVIANNLISSGEYGVYMDQSGGTTDFTLNNNNIITGSDDYTVYFDLAGGTSSQLTMNGNILGGYYGLYVDQTGVASSNVTFNNNTQIACVDPFYATYSSGTNTLTISGNTLTGQYPIYIDQTTGTLDLAVTNNVLTAASGDAFTYETISGASTSTQTITGNTILCTGSAGVDYNLGGTGNTISATVTGNTISSTGDAFASLMTVGTFDLDLSNNIVTNSGGFSLRMFGGTSTWEVNDNQLTAISNTPVIGTATGGVACMQLNGNAVYPTSSANAYVLNGTGATSFTLNPPTGNTGNTNISTTDVTTGSCP